MNELRKTAARLLEQHQIVMRVSIIATRGSTPQSANCHMLVTREQIAGTIGGGNLEWQAIARARALLNSHAPAPETLRVVLGATLGQCCGGEVNLRFERVSAALLARWPDESAQFELHLYGMGHVAQALVRTLRHIACVLHWYDSRVELVQKLAHEFDRPSGSADIGQSALPQASINFLEFDASGAIYGPEFESASDPSQPLNPSPPKLALIMTHNHALDFELCRALLPDIRFAFVGLIGSASKRAQFLRRLAARGASEAQCARLSCPIGLATLNHKSPELLAIAVAAQLLEVVQSPSARTCSAAVPTRIHEHPPLHA